MKIDLHVHSLPVSRCARFEAEEVPGRLKAAGVDAFCLCNHYYPGHLSQVGRDLPEQIEAFISCFERCQAAARTLGMTVLFGAEVKLIQLPSHPEFLLYGLTPRILRKALPLYDYTQEQLYEFCQSEDILMYQAHPYRTEQGYAPADPVYMDGTEVYNGHAIFDPKYERTLKFARSHGLALSAGSDFHDPEDAGRGGIIVPDNVRITNALELRDYLKENREPEIYAQAL